VGAFCKGTRRLTRLLRLDFFFVDAETEGFEEEYENATDCGIDACVAVDEGSRSANWSAEPERLSDKMGERDGPTARRAEVDQRDDLWVSLPLAGDREKAAEAGIDAKTKDTAIGSHLITFLVLAESGPPDSVGMGRQRSRVRCVDSKAIGLL
jgi:hypothetical protein